MKVFIELIIKLSIISCCLLFKTTFAAFGIKYTGTLAAIIDPNGVYYYEYDSYIAKCQLSDGTVVAKQQLTSPLRFSTVAISPDGAYLLFAVGPVTTSDSFNSGIGIFKTDTSTFGESSSLKINYYDGSTEQNPRYEKIIIFNSKLENLKTTSYDIMIGGRANYANDNDKDIFLIYSGLFHGSNKTIEILKYYLFNQGSPTISQTLEATLPDYRETGFLAFVELDSPNQASVVCLTKFMEPVSTAQGYQVNLMSMKRDLSQLNWMLRFNNNYQAEVKLKTNLYLMITRGSDLYIEIINPSNGSVLQSIHYTIGNNEYLYYPQMAISNRFNTLFLLSSVRNITASPTPLQNQLMRVTLFSTADLSIMSDSFTFSQVSTPYTIDILQLSSSEQVIIKGTLDSVVNTNEQRFTLSLYPLVHTQSISTCSLSSYLNAIGVSGSLSSVTEASLSGLLTDISSNIRLYSSGITYVASPPALTTVSLCSVSTITPLEIVGTQSTYHTQNFSLKRMNNKIID